MNAHSLVGRDDAQLQNEPMARREIPPERKTAYYAGMALTGLGVLIFLSVFVTAISNFGNFSNFHGQAKSTFGRAIVGMVVIGIGQLMMRVGHSGLAGSGIKLDPREAREDLEPWSRMSGGMVSDALDEAGIDFGGSKDGGELHFDEQLRKLEALKAEGLISVEEYEDARKRVLEGIG